ncbi:MAG TPA: kelch repeat-containing protein, partial [Candidatus Polarisedimenticolia bacterium]|nr:kelch repeat-containing protein [Candidatus Polarisedimenticolia bacterium]
MAATKKERGLSGYLVGALVCFLFTGIMVRGLAPQVPSGTWVPTGSLSEPRAGAAATQLSDGRVLISGGIGPGGALGTTELFDAEGSFSAAASMNVA